MSNTIGRAKILTAPCIFFKKRYAAPVREDFRGGFAEEDFGEDFRGREAGKKAGAGGTGQDEPQARTERDKADESGRDRAAAGPTEAGRAWKRKRRRGRWSGRNEASGERGASEAAAGRQKLAERGRGSRNGETKKTGETRKTGKAGKCWKMLEKTGKSDRGLPGRRSGGTGRERHSAVKPRRYRSLKPSSSTSTGQYSRSSSRRKRTV